MTDTVVYYPNKFIAAPSSGGFNNTWATPVNTDWSQIDLAFGGNVSVALSGSSPLTLTSSQYIPPNITLTGTLTGNFRVDLPAAVPVTGTGSPTPTPGSPQPPGPGGIWSVFNNTTGGFNVNFGVTGGTAVTIPNGQRVLVLSDGVNAVTAFSNSAAGPGDPTAAVGLTAINGTSGSYMRADAAPVLNQAIAPTWTGAHTFSSTVSFTNTAQPTILAYDTVNSASKQVPAGFNYLPACSVTANYTAALSDNGQMFLMNGTGLTFTVPANSTTAFPVGSVLTLVNSNASAVTIAITTPDTMVIAGTTTAAPHTLIFNGIATILKVGTTSWLVTGVGLS